MHSLDSQESLDEKAREKGRNTAILLDSDSDALDSDDENNQFGVERIGSMTRSSSGSDGSDSDEDEKTLSPPPPAKKKVTFAT